MTRRTRSTRRTARTRRRLIGAGLALPLVGWRTAGARQLAPTPACGKPGDAAAATPRQGAGPFYTPNSPRRSSLIEPGAPGVRLILSGRVWSTACRPVAGALIDIWHCDAQGEYDSSGYRYRGHLFADADGAYRLETIVPGRYPGRTRHIHVRLQAPGGAPLTTQLYFPGEPGNADDAIWRRELEIAPDTRAGDAPRAGRFDFVLVV